MTDPNDLVEPEGTSSDVIADAWAKALEVECVDVDAGFFDLGASSATVLEAVRALRIRWPHLRVVDVFAHPTVAQLAAFVDRLPPG